MHRFNKVTEKVATEKSAARCKFADTTPEFHTVVHSLRRTEHWAYLQLIYQTRSLPRLSQRKFVYVEI